MEDLISLMHHTVVDFRYISAYDALCRLVDIFGADVISSAVSGPTPVGADAEDAEDHGERRRIDSRGRDVTAI